MRGWLHCWSSEKDLIKQSPNSLLRTDAHVRRKLLQTSAVLVVFLRELDSFCQRRPKAPVRTYMSTYSSSVGSRAWACRGYFVPVAGIAALTPFPARSRSMPIRQPEGQVGTERSGRDKLPCSELRMNRRRRPGVFTQTLIFIDMIRRFSYLDDESVETTAR